MYAQPRFRTDYNDDITSDTASNSLLAKIADIFCRILFFSASKIGNFLYLHVIWGNIPTRNRTRCFGIILILYSADHPWHYLQQQPFCRDFKYFFMSYILHSYLFISSCHTKYHILVNINLQIISLSDPYISLFLSF